MSADLALLFPREEPSSASQTKDNTDGMGNELIVAIASLIIALIALLGTILQVLQQYYSSATGFSSCSQKVIGKWSSKTYRKLNFKELRFEVRFETPVVFVCSVKNEAGPVKDARVVKILGDPRSEQLALTDELDTKKNDKKKHSAAEKEVHTADNEKATWVKMLTEIQRMEQDSREWERKQSAAYEEVRQDLIRREQQSGLGERPKPRERVIPRIEDRTLCVALQSKKRSWDTMPPNIKRPYATTTMCHLVEMAAMLGLHWKEFDQSKDKFRAEGNGYVLTGTDVPDLGLMFNFQISGKSKFEENRLIPTNSIKDFVFGIVPTVFVSHTDDRRLELLAEDPRELGYLLLGSVNEVAETVAWFGCNTRTADTFRDNSKRHGHLFPLAFEIVGMLSKTLYIKDTWYRMLPNPTVYHWDKKFFDLPLLISEFQRTISADGFKRVLPKKTVHIPADLLDPMHELVSRAEAICRAYKKARGAQLMAPEVCDALFFAVEWCDEKLKGKLSLVKFVLREHIQEVLRIVNNEEVEKAEEGESGKGPGAGGDADSDESGTDDDETYTSPTATPKDGIGAARNRQSRFDRLSAAAPEQRHKVFMDIYVTVVLPRVRRHLRQSPLHLRTDSMGDLTLIPISEQPSPAGSRSPSPSPSRSPSPSLSPVSLHMSANGQQTQPNLPPLTITQSGLLNNTKDAQSKVMDSHKEIEVSTTWCILVFRMLCWLMLHDFHKKDRQVSSKSELWGSRLPVYIG